VLTKPVDILFPNYNIKPVQLFFELFQFLINNRIKGLYYD